VAETVGGATSKRTKRKKLVAAGREEAIGIGYFPLPSFAMGLALRPLGVEWSAGSLLLGTPSLSLWLREIANPDAFHSFVAGLAALYKWQHGGTGRGMGMGAVAYVYRRVG
jgi:hypothetical protein